MNPSKDTALPRLQRATIHDAGRLADLAARLFEWTYRGIDDPQDVAIHIQEKLTPAPVARTIKDPHAVIFIAEAQSELCGFAHLQLGNAMPQVAAARPAELIRLYVDPSKFGTGLGAALLEAVLEAAHSEQVDVIWLIVHHRNPRAKAFYIKHGFHQVGKCEYHIGESITVDDLLARPVTAPMAA